MAQFLLFANSNSDTAYFHVEWDYSESKQKIQNDHRMQDGGLYQYKYGEYTKIKAPVTYVTSDYVEMVSSWWGANTELHWVEEGSNNSFSVKITNKKRPIDKKVMPYSYYYMGTLELEGWQ